MEDVLVMTGVAAFGFLIAGCVEFFTRLRARDFWTALTIAAAAVFGAILGHFDPFALSLNWALGAAYGLAMSGLISTVGHIGNNSTPTETKAFAKD